MMEPKLNCCLDFITKHVVMSLKMLLQFGKEMKM